MYYVYKVYLWLWFVFYIMYLARKWVGKCSWKLIFLTVETQSMSGVICDFWVLVRKRQQNKSLVTQVSSKALSCSQNMLSCLSQMWQISVGLLEMTRYSWPLFVSLWRPHAACPALAICLSCATCPPATCSLSLWLSTVPMWLLLTLRIQIVQGSE